VIATPNPGGKLRPNMTATITFNIAAKDDVLRLPVAALRFIPTLTQARPEDRHYLDLSTASSNTKRTVTEKVDLAQQRMSRTVWVEDGQFLRAVRVTLGLIDRQNAEVLTGLALDERVVTGIDTTTPR
jgi:HlyD family secretion protein